MEHMYYYYIYIFVFSETIYTYIRNMHRYIECIACIYILITKVNFVLTFVYILYIFLFSESIYACL